MHEAISTVDDVATQLVLTRRCVDVCRVTHLLRARGPDVGARALAEFDGLMRQTVERVLGGPVDDNSFAQATAGVQDVA